MIDIPLGSYSDYLEGPSCITAYSAPSITQVCCCLIKADLMRKLKSVSYTEN